MAKPTIYTWRDDGAPVYTGDMPTFKNLVESCLVSGYGNKSAPAGDSPWTTIALQDGSFVLRQGGSSNRKCCMWFKSFRVSYIRALPCDDFSGTQPIRPWIADFETNGFGAGYYYNGLAQDRPIPWVIIATARSVYMFFGCGSADGDEFDSSPFSWINRYNTYDFFFGDYLPESNTQTNNQMAIVRQVNSYPSIYGYTCGFNILNDSPVCRVIAGTFDNGSDATQAHIMTSRPLINGISGLSTTDYRYKLDFPSRLTGGLYLDKIHIVAANTIFGRMPGLLYSPQVNPLESNDAPVVIEAPGSPTGNRLWVFTCPYGANMFIDSGDWGVE